MGIKVMEITSSPSGGLYKHCLFFSYQHVTLTILKVTRSIQLLDKQPLLCNHMPVSYNNTIAQLLGILPNHQQRDCSCRHCACLCHQRKGTTHGNRRHLQQHFSHCEPTNQICMVYTMERKRISRQISKNNAKQDCQQPQDTTEHHIRQR